MSKNLILGTVIGLVILAGVGVYIATGSSNDSMSYSNASTTNQPTRVDMSAIPDDLEAQVQKAISRQPMDNVIVLDVRTDEEWNTERATDAFHWGLAEHISKGELPPLGKNMEIYVYCRSGNRAGQAIKILEDSGYTNLTNISGLTDWKAAGGATITGFDTSDQSDGMAN